MSTKLTYATIYDRAGDCLYDSTDEGSTCAEIFACEEIYRDFSYALLFIPINTLTVRLETFKRYVNEVLPQCFLPAAVVEEKHGDIIIGISAEDILPTGKSQNVYLPEHLLGIVSGVRYGYHPHAIGIVQRTMQLLSLGMTPWNALQMAHLVSPSTYSSYYGLQNHMPFKLVSEEELLINIADFEEAFENDDSIVRRLSLSLPDSSLAFSWEQEFWPSVNNLFHMYINPKHAMCFNLIVPPRSVLPDYDTRMEVSSYIHTLREGYKRGWRWVYDLFDAGEFQLVREILTNISELPTTRMEFAKEFAINPYNLKDYEKQRQSGLSF